MRYRDMAECESHDLSAFVVSDLSEEPRNAREIDEVENTCVYFLWGNVLASSSIDGLVHLEVICSHRDHFLM